MKDVLRIMAGAILGSVFGLLPGGLLAGLAYSYAPFSTEEPSLYLAFGVFVASWLTAAVIGGQVEARRMRQEREGKPNVTPLS